MNRIAIHAAGIPDEPWFKSASRFSTQVLEMLGKDGWILSIVVSDDSFIQNLNKEYRQKDESTDVLSFPMGDFTEDDGKTWYLAGDIIISIPALERNVAEFKVGVNEELKRLLLHGILHLCGLDHEDNNPDQPMLKEQERILAKLEGVEIL